MERTSKAVELENSALFFPLSQTNLTRIQVPDHKVSDWPSSNKVLGTSRKITRALFVQYPMVERDVKITKIVITVGTRLVRRPSVITPAKTELTGCFSGRSGRACTVRSVLAHDRFSLPGNHRVRVYHLRRPRGGRMNSKFVSKNNNLPLDSLILPSSGIFYASRSPLFLDQRSSGGPVSGAG